MAANIEKINGCFRAIGTFLANVLTLKFPLWLYIVVFLASALFALLVSCAHDRSIQRVVVGHCTEAGHSYVFFRPENNPDIIAVVHDPSCDCWTIEPFKLDE